MANYRRTATGNWSTLAQWQDDSTGSYVASTVLPGATDIVYANNFTVTLDIDVVVLELRTTSALNVNAGGLFDFGAGSSVTANVFAGTTTCVRNNTANIKTITGNIIGGTSTSASGCQITSSGGLVINGNINGFTANNSEGVRITGAGSVIVNGTVTAGSGTGAIGVRGDGAGTITVNGVVVGGSLGFTSFGVAAFAAGTIFVTKAIAGATNAGVFTSSGFAVVNETEDNPNGRQACEGRIFRKNTGVIASTVYKENGTAVTLVDNSVPNYPLEADVEQGVGYGPANIYTGTLVASITPQDIFTAIANSSDPVAVRLRNVSTVATTAATVASFDV